MHDHDHQTGTGEVPSGLTKNELLVWETLAESPDPLKAYEILDRLKEKGVRAPMTVYRALEGLEAKGHIHKLDGLNAFLPCNHEGPHPIQAFLFCEHCDQVSEVEFSGVESGLTASVRQSGFEITTARLEIKGRCMSCSLAAGGIDEVAEG